LLGASVAPAATRFHSARIRLAGFIRHFGGFVASPFRGGQALPRVRSSSDAVQPTNEPDRRTTMSAYNPISWKKKTILAVLTLGVAVGLLEVVSNAMVNPDPETMAVRERVIAMQGERAAQIRELQKGEMRVAGATDKDRI
jgi:hypothetical protein